MSYSDLTPSLLPAVNWPLFYHWLGRDAHATARAEQERQQLRRESPEDPADG